MTQADWAIFLEDVDVNKDGNISMDEFLNLLEKACIR
jgi:Ca2+-binding EF-hand superfamily protein